MMPARNPFGLAVAALLGLSVLLAGAARADETMTFRSGCASGERIVVAAVGDLLFHNALQRQSLVPGGTYRQFWAPLGAVLDGADLTYGNLEGPVAQGVAIGGYAVKDPGRKLDGRVYGAPRGSLIFNYHPSLVADLKTTGFDVVSTANNHAADRGSVGIDRTIASLRAHELSFTGTRVRDEPPGRWSVRTSARGFNVAWLACTYSTNGMPDRHRQTLNCYDDKARILEEIRWNAQDPDVDAVILTPHWGVEKAPAPLKSDRVYAQDMIEAGASAVVGTHPHVLQGWEKLTTSEGRDGLVIYSTGNFISNQVSDDQRTGIVALLEFTRVEGRKAEVSAAGYVLTWVERGRHRVAELRLTERRGARGLPAALRRLPAGNRVTAASFRTLPRSCPVTAANETLPAR